MQAQKVSENRVRLPSGNLHVAAQKKLSRSVAVVATAAIGIQRNDVSMRIMVVVCGIRNVFDLLLSVK